MFKFKKELEGDNTQKSWKEKAKERRLENKRLKKQLEEMSKSRDNWRAKAKKLENKNQRLNETLKKNFK